MCSTMDTIMSSRDSFTLLSSNSIFKNFILPRQHTCTYVSNIGVIFFYKKDTLNITHTYTHTPEDTYECDKYTPLHYFRFIPNWDPGGQCFNDQQVGTVYYWRQCEDTTQQTGELRQRLPLIHHIIQQLSTQYQYVLQ